MTTATTSKKAHTWAQLMMQDPVQMVAFAETLTNIAEDIHDRAWIKLNETSKSQWTKVYLWEDALDTILGQYA